MPEHISRIVIVSDRGAEQEAIDAADKIATARHNTRVSIVHMPQDQGQGHDANDVLREGGAGALREIMAVARPRVFEIS